MSTYRATFACDVGVCSSFGGSFWLMEFHRWDAPHVPQAGVEGAVAAVVTQWQLCHYMKGTV